VKDPVGDSIQMKRHFRTVLCSLLVVTLSAPAAFPDEAKNAYKNGVRAESQNQYDQAFDEFKKAYTLKPKDPKYTSAYLRIRTSAAEEHVHQGQLLRANQKLQEAVIEFQRAMEIDPTNFVARQELQSTADALKKQMDSQVPAAPAPESLLAKMAREAEGPVDLEPTSDNRLTLRLTTTADNVYKTIGKLAGINVLFDLDYKPQRISIELDDVPLKEALRMVAMQSKTFWRPVSTKAIFVAAESKRKEFEDNVMKTFYLRNVSTPADLQEAVATLKGIMDISRIQVNAAHNSITIRGTLDQMVLAEKILSDLDKPKSEVMVDIVVMEVSRDRLRTLGTTLPTTVSIAPPANLTLQSISHLNSGDFSLVIPGASVTALMSDSHTKILQNPEVRVLDQEKATLKIGDRIPIATGSYSTGAISGGGVSPLINTQFQYLDVGVNIDVTPRVHADKEVTLKMVLEVSSVSGSQTIGGITQPTIGQRRIEHETRLKDGEVSLVGGILEDQETRSLSGYPWLASLPILKYLFGQENVTRQQVEIVFAITPHIVRSEEVTEENGRLIDIGSSTALGLRRPEPQKKQAASKAVKPTTRANAAQAPQTTTAGGPSH
jgi:general secretion pathway protein D